MHDHRHTRVRPSSPASHAMGRVRAGAASPGRHALSTWRPGRIMARIGRAIAEMGDEMTLHQLVRRHPGGITKTEIRRHLPHLHPTQLSDLLLRGMQRGEIHAAHMEKAARPGVFEAVYWHKTAGFTQL
ncbi:MAG: hypothetical protein HQL52_03820 [Magnetococcales bacterium]|nr:hypothetical protein [Magnetococcales bacterium]